MKSALSPSARNSRARSARVDCIALAYIIARGVSSKPGSGGGRRSPLRQLVNRLTR